MRECIYYKYYLCTACGLIPANTREKSIKYSWLETRHTHTDTTHTSTHTHTLALPTPGRIRGNDWLSWTCMWMPKGRLTTLMTRLTEGSGEMGTEVGEKWDRKSQSQNQIGKSRIQALLKYEQISNKTPKNHGGRKWKYRKTDKKKSKSSLDVCVCMCL